MAIAAVADGIRYLRSGPDSKIPVVEIPLKSKTKPTLIIVYNAYGGIYPGLADIVHKEFFPVSYPCRLCYLAFGSFGPKPAWTQLLDSLPMEKKALHKDTYQRQYSPVNLPLPAILLSNGQQASVLVSAAEINNQNSLAELVELLREKLLRQPG